jgi:hypothetical protein
MPFIIGFLMLIAYLNLVRRVEKIEEYINSERTKQVFDKVGAKDE